MVSGRLLNKLHPTPRCCSAVSWPMVSGRQLSWFPGSRRSCNSVVSWPIVSETLLHQLYPRSRCCSAVSWPMLSGRLLSWFPPRHRYYNRVSWPMLSGRQVRWLCRRSNSVLGRKLSMSRVPTKVQAWLDKSATSGQDLGQGFPPTLWAHQSPLVHLLLEHSRLLHSQQ